MLFKKILIANRGEIACRIIKTCQRLGIETVAIFSTIDRQSLFVEQANEAFHLGSNELKGSYLNSQKIIDIALKSNCQAIHPGYGFLSENAQFATLCEKNNIRFIGPSSQSIELMGCKKQAKKIMSDNSIPVVPGFNIEVDDEKVLQQQANDIGYPILIKAASGGGGKGMKLVNSSADLISSINSAKRESIKSFDSDKLLAEKYLPKPRHIEVQVFADNHDNYVHLFDRDCSIQRRHQKIIEEAPAINIPHDVRQSMFQTAINAAKTINYSGAGTIEFLLDGNNFYFMEMNTRLQVEHPVTEYITNIDLVEWQLRIASNQTLPLPQSKIKNDGHAIEVRLYAEDPDNSFLPQTGTLSDCHFPKESNNLRIDTGVRQQDEISVHYDPMIAKVISHSPSRQAASQQLINALETTVLTGPTTNLSFLKNILRQEAFIDGQLNTHYIDNNPIKNKTSIQDACLYLATYQQLKSIRASISPWQQKDYWQSNLNQQIDHAFEYKDLIIKSSLSIKGANEFTSGKDTNRHFHAYLNEQDHLIFENNGMRQQIKILQNSTQFHVLTASAQYTIQTYSKDYSQLETPQGSLNAPMPGTIISINCEKGQYVEKNQILMIVEAMKMEHPIKAPFAGKIDDIFFETGSQISDSDSLLSLLPESIEA